MSLYLLFKAEPSKHNTGNLIYDAKDVGTLDMEDKKTYMSHAWKSLCLLVTRSPASLSRVHSLGDRRSCRTQHGHSKKPEGDPRVNETYHKYANSITTYRHLPHFAKLGKSLGHGSQAAVYANQKNRRQVVKIVDQKRNLGMRGVIEPYLLSMFRLRKNRCKHLPRIHRVFRIGTAICVVMERVPGKTVKKIFEEWIKTKGDASRHGTPFTEDVTCHIAAAILKAVKKLHNMGFIHADISFNNVMFDEKSGRVTLIDFGLAAVAKKKSAHDASNNVRQAGTLSFMPPEVILKNSPDLLARIIPEDRNPKRDIFSVGSLIYYMLTGKAPLDRKFTRNYASQAFGTDDYSFDCRINVPSIVRLKRLQTYLKINDASFLQSRDLECLDKIRRHYDLPLQRRALIRGINKLIKCAKDREKYLFGVKSPAYIEATRLFSQDSWAFMFSPDGPHGNSCVIANEELSRTAKKIIYAFTHPCAADRPNASKALQLISEWKEKLRRNEASRR